MSPKQSSLMNATAGSQVPGAQVAEEQTSADPPVETALHDRSEYRPVVPGIAVHVPSGCLKLMIGFPVQVALANAFAETSRASQPVANSAARRATAARMRDMVG